MPRLERHMETNSDWFSSAVFIRFTQWTPHSCLMDSFRENGGLQRSTKVLLGDESLIMYYKACRNVHAMLRLRQGRFQPQSFKDGSGP